MRAARLSAALALVAAVGAAPAADDPLRLVPRQADLVLRVDSPRKLVEAITAAEPLRELGQFTAVREAFQSTNVRRLQKLLAYYEKELGAPWPDLLDRAAGGGAVVALKFDRGGNTPVLLVVQSKDEDMLRRATKAVLKVVEQELVRQDSKDRPTAETYRGLETIRVGTNLHLALAGSALLVSNKAEGLHRGLDLYINGRHDSLIDADGPAAARKLLPPDPLWSLWVNLVPAQQSPEGKEIFKQPKGDVGQLVFLGGLLDVIGQAPFLAAGSYRAADGWRHTVRFPRGRDATPDGRGLHLAPPGQPGCPPPLAPKNVLFSTSFYLDHGRLWTDRDKLMTERARQQFDMAEKNVGRFLAGRKLSELLTQSGPYHRFVAAAQDKAGYAKHPTQTIPAFAYVVSMRDPAFGKAVDPMLRGAALLAGFQARLKMVEEEIDGVRLIGYRFPEDGKLPGDVNDIRFNFSPCFATVGDQFFAASTVELGRELVGLLRQKPGPTPDSAADRSILAAAGGAALLTAFQDQLLVQAALDRAAPIDDVRQEVGRFVTWLRGLGVLHLDTDYLPHELRFEVKWVK